MTDLRVPAPMLASPFRSGQTVSQFEGNAEWIAEPKLDGVRCTVRISEGVVAAWSRPRAGGNGALKRTLPAHIVDALRQFPNMVLDGELVCPGGKSPDVARLDNQAKLRYVVFDVLELLGTTVIDRPYYERRAYLEQMFKTLQFPAVELILVAPVSKTLIDAWMSTGGEGAVLKRIDARYRPGARVDYWLKVKGLKSAVLTITGFRSGKLGPCSRIDLIDSDGQTTSVACAGMGHAMLRTIEANPTAYIGRQLAIEYTENIGDGSYRHPRADHFVD